MEKRRKEIAEKWNDFARKQEPFELKHELFGGDREAMVAEFEEYLGDADIMVSQTFSGDRIGSVFRFIFPEKDKRALAVLNYLKVAHEYRFVTSKVGVTARFENDLMFADFTVEVKPDGKIIEYDEEQFSLDEIRSITINDGLAAMEVTGERQLEYIDLSEYGDYHLALALAKALEDFLHSDETYFSFTDTIEAWEEEQLDEEEGLFNMPAA